VESAAEEWGSYLYRCICYPNTKKYVAVTSLNFAHNTRSRWYLRCRAGEGSNMYLNALTRDVNSPQ
jgi:hypothetical protein